MGVEPAAQGQNIVTEKGGSRMTQMLHTAAYVGSIRPVTELLCARLGRVG
jgi:hypothetical protein